VLHSPAFDGVGESQFGRLERKLSTLSNLRVKQTGGHTVTSWRVGRFSVPSILSQLTEAARSFQQWGLQPEPEFVYFQDPRNRFSQPRASLSSLAGRYDYIGWWNRFLGSLTNSGSAHVYGLSKGSPQHTTNRATVSWTN
jgi:hypothetical protein